MNEPNCNSELESGLDVLINSLRNPESLIYAFWLSVFLLLIISLLKYSIAKECEKRDWGNFVLELPIDVCLVVITIIITGYMQGTNLAIGMLLVLFSLLVSIACCIFRRISIKHSYDEGIKGEMVIFGILDIVLALGWVFFIYAKII